METLKRTLLKLEMKSLVFHRKEARKLSKELQQKTSFDLEQLRKDQVHWKDPRWKWFWRDIGVLTEVRTDKAKEIRHFNIAYGLLRGVSYRKMEKKCLVPPNAKAILDIIKRFAGAESCEWNLNKVEELLK